MKIESLIPVFAVAAGWFLNETAQVIKRKNQDKKPYSRAIAELLEIRHSIIGTLTYIDSFNEKFKLPEDIWLQIKPQIVKLLFTQVVNIEDIKKRYGEAVNGICDLDPLIGFNLRSKDVITQIIQFLDNVEQDQSITSVFQKEMLTIYSPVLNYTIQQLAWKHGIFTWWKIKKYMKYPIIPLELNSHLDHIYDQMMNPIINTDPLSEGILQGA